jgi:hypothetical protein
VERDSYNRGGFIKWLYDFVSEPRAARIAGTVALADAALASDPAVGKRGSLSGASDAAEVDAAIKTAEENANIRMSCGRSYNELRCALELYRNWAETSEPGRVSLPPARLPSEPERQGYAVRLDRSRFDRHTAPAAEKAPEPATGAVSAPEVAPAPAAVAVSAPEVAPEPAAGAVSAPEVAPEPVAGAVSAPEVAPEPAAVAVSAPEAAPEPAAVAVSAPEVASEPTYQALSAPVISVRERFTMWLRRGGMTEEAAKTRVSEAVEGSLAYTELGYGDRALFNAGTSDEAGQITEKLLSDDFFVNYIDRGGRYRSAFGCFLSFLRSEQPEPKPSAPASAQVSEPAPVPAVSPASAPVPEPVPVSGQPEQSEEPGERLNRLIAEKYPRGLNIGSPIDRRRLSDAYAERCGGGETPEKLMDEAVKSGFVCGRRVYSPYIVDEKTKDEIVSCIAGLFAHGAGTVSCYAVFVRYSPSLVYVSDPQLLCALILRWRDPRLAGIAASPDHPAVLVRGGEKHDGAEDVRACLVNYGGALDFDELRARLPQFSRDELRKILLRREFLSVSAGRYVHLSCVYLPDEALETVRDMIGSALDVRRCLTRTELIGRLRGECPELLDNNSAFEDAGHAALYKAIACRLGEFFDFKGNIVSARGDNLSSSDVMRAFYDENPELTLDQINAFREEADIRAIDFDDLLRHKARTSPDHFVSYDRCGFDAARVDAALETLVPGEYLPLAAVTRLSLLPPANYAWNTWLLESYAASVSRVFAVLNQKFSSSVCAGVIIRRSVRRFGDYTDVLADALASRPGELLGRNAALGYLADEGYLARKLCSDIDCVLRQAAYLRSEKMKSEGGFAAELR